MKIYADGDALPGEAKRLLFKAAERTRQEIVVVANQPLKVPAHVHQVTVPGGFNGADDWIVERVEPGDLVVTADVPLASRVVDKGACALDPRGYLYTESVVKQRLATRNLMDDLRGAGLLLGGGPPPWGKKDAQKFANELNAYLTRSSSQR